MREPQLALSLEGEWELVRGPLEPLDLARFERESFESLRCSVTDRTSASCPWLAVLMIARALGDPTSRAWRAALAIDATAAEPALADALIDRTYNQIARHFRDGNDLEAVRSTRALLAHFERHSPADARSSNRVLVSPARREGPRFAMEALRRATSREASSPPASRVAQLVADLADCPVPVWNEPVECPAMDELARIGEDAIEPLIVALERDRRPTRFTRVVGREFVPVAMLAELLLAQWFVDLGEHAISAAPSAPDEQRWAASAAAYRAYRGSLRGRTPIRALIDRWTDPTLACSSVGPLRTAWMNCGHGCATPFERATIDERRSIVEGIVPVVSRCGGESYCVLSRWLEAAPRGAEREALIERIFAADRRTPQLFEHLVRDHERRAEGDRTSFALRHFAEIDGEPTIEAWASRIDAVASLSDDPTLNRLVLETLRARGVLRDPTRRALLVRLTTARTTAVAREMLAPLLADRAVIGTLQIQREKSLLTVAGVSRWAGRTPSAPEGTYPWRACDSIAMELCSNEGALLNSVSARDAHIAHCAREGPRAVMGGAAYTACTNSVMVSAWALAGE